MPGKIKVKVLAGRNLPVMDRASETTDAFVEIKFGGVTHKTDVCRKSLNPHWNSTEWYRFEVDESELQDEPLQLRLMDHDTYSANDAIGKVVISLAPLLAREANNVNNTIAPHGGAVMSGWIPVFDTMHGIRGELNVIVKVELFSDFNKYKTSSCGVQFFHCPMIPPGYRATTIHGFVEELVVNDDPEYQWIDKIRTPRASNEARQVAFIKLSNQVQRLVGLKAAELGANAVIGYQQDFDLEGEAGVVARAIGTAVSISPIPTQSQQINIPPCTQQQLKKYLDILASDGDNITDLKQYYQKHQEELQKLLTILNPNASSLLDEPMDDDDDRSLELARPSNASSYAGNISLYQDYYISHKSLKDISEDQTDLNRLLNRKDDYDSDSSGPLQKMKKLKSNFFSKKFSLRSRKSEKDSDQVSLKSNSSDSSRITLIDIKNEFKKLKRIKKPKFRRADSCKEEQGEGMVSILARSVIHAHTSLACIAEKDSDHSPSSTLRRTSGSEPTIVIDEDKHKNVSETTGEMHDNTNEIPEIHFTSLTNISSEEPVPERQRKISESCPTSPVVARSENLLKLPGDPDYYGSISSALSGESSEIYSSSDEDDESSDVKTYTDGSFETTSSVVQSVLNHEVDPAIIVQMDKKLNILESATPEPTDMVHDDLFSKPQLLELVTHDLENNRNEEIEVTIQEEPSTSTEDTNKVRDKGISEHKPFGLLHTAMETILMDKVQTLVGPTTPEPDTLLHFDEYNKKVKTKTTESSGLIHTAIETMLLDKVQSVLPETREPIPVKTETLLKDKQKTKKVETNKGVKLTGLVHTAMETMLLEKAQSVLPETPKLIVVTEPSFEKNEPELKGKGIKPTGLVHTAMETMLLEKVQSVLPETHKKNPVKTKVSVDEKLEIYDGPGNASQTSELVHSKIIDKTKDLTTTKPIPETSKNATSNEFENYKSVEKSLDIGGPSFDIKSGNIKEDYGNDNNGTSSELVGIAIETIPIEKFQSVLDSDTPETNFKNNYMKKVECDESISLKMKSPGLVKTAMDTILIDKTQSQIPQTVEEVDTKNLESDAKDTNEPANYVDKAIKNIDKLQNLITATESKGSQDPCLVETEQSQKKPKLVRQDSVSSAQSLKMSNENLPTIKPMLQHFHPVLSGAILETIPSLPESIDNNESLEVEQPNDSFGVCGNLHAVCGVDRDRTEPGRGSPRHARHESYGGKEPVQTQAHAQNSSLNASSTPMGIHRRSSDSDLSVTPKGGSLNTSAGNVGSGGGAILKPSMNSNNLDMLEYPFLTMTEFPPGFIVHIGGTVCARSVKLAEGEGGARATWWAELRTELRAHARALRCNAVVAYSDSAAICEDVCVLSASGTAVVINLDCGFNADPDGNNASSGSKNAIDELEADSCSIAHVPYSPGAGPYRAELSTCGGCRRARVPAVLLATCAKPNRLVSYGKAITLTAVAARVRRAPPTAEPGARDISDQLPFLEYELHKLLLAKLRMQGANAIFSLQTQIAVGERCVMALASGTAVRLAALPPPTPPRIKASENDKDAVDIQKALWDSFTANKAANGYDIGGVDHNTNGALPEVDGEDAPALDLCADKDACVLELDEAEYVETARLLAVRRYQARVYCGDMTPRSDPPHAFAQVWRARAGAGAGAGAGAEKVAARALEAAAYKLRRLRPCALAPPRFHLELPEDEIQLVVFGTAIPLVDPSKPVAATENGDSSVGNHASGDTDDDIFALDEEQLVRNNNQVEAEEKTGNGQSPRCVSVSSVWCVGGAGACRRVCALRLLFVRETTAVRELGGLSGFLHTFTCEVLAIVRAYTAALGGNALTSFYITQLMLQDNAHKNQGQCLLSVGGDVVYVTY